MSIIYGEEYENENDVVALDEMEKPSSELIEYLKEIHKKKESDNSEYS